MNEALKKSVNKPKRNGEDIWNIASLKITFFFFVFKDKNARLIVRNLSFKISHADLLQQLSKFGNVEELHIATNEKGLRKGFAFVQYSSTSEAQQVLSFYWTLLIPPHIFRPIFRCLCYTLWCASPYSFSFSIPCWRILSIWMRVFTHIYKFHRTIFSSHSRNLPHKKLITIFLFLYCKKAIKNLNAQKIDGRVVAIDWAIPKSKYQQEDASKQPNKESQTELNGIKSKIRWK